MSPEQILASDHFETLMRSSKLRYPFEPSITCDLLNSIAETHFAALDSSMIAGLYWKRKQVAGIGLCLLLGYK